MLTWGTKAKEYIATNMVANVLGLGWAATPAGIKAMEELAEAKNAISRLGLKLEKVAEFPVDGTAHTVIVLRKVAPTPPKYPRRFAQIKKSPL